MFLEISQNSQENTCARVSFLIKFKKETLAQVFSCEYCEISKDTFFTEHLRATASENRFLFWLVTFADVILSINSIDKTKFWLCTLLLLFITITIHYHSSQPARNVPGTSPKGPLKVVTSGTSKGLSGDSYGTNKKIDDLMKKEFFRCNSLCFTHLLLIFTGKTNIQKF